MLDSSFLSLLFPNIQTLGEIIISFLCYFLTFKH